MCQSEAAASPLTSTLRLGAGDDPETGGLVPSLDDDDDDDDDDDHDDDDDDHDDDDDDDDDDEDHDAEVAASMTTQPRCRGGC